MSDDITIDDGVTIPPLFWKTLTDEEYRRICDTSMLSRPLCRRLWAMTGRKGKPPRTLMVLLREEDVKRLFPAKDEMH